MEVFDLAVERRFAMPRHLERVLATVGNGDVSIACWEPGQISPNHCHPAATEIYLCWEGGGTMRAPSLSVDVSPGRFVAHPPGELHEYVNGPQRTVLYRIRYGTDLSSRHWHDRGDPDRPLSDEDVDYFRRHPVPETYLREPDEGWFGRSTKG